MTKKITLHILAVLASFNLSAQAWKVEIKSNVELRTWKLTGKKEAVESPCAGASIKLYKGGGVVASVQSDAMGNFSILVPPNDNFIIEVSYPGCNTKKFDVNTNGVPPDVGVEGYKPGFDIGGFVMAKPLPGVDYSALKTPLASISYVPRKRNFDDDEAVTQQGLSIVSSIQMEEEVIMKDFCAQNAQGDAALSKGDCALAKTLYEKAQKMIAGEP
ncbi:MAG: hypothetical protein ACXVOH_13880, partial [Bacteroidia bacterium]